MKPDWIKSAERTIDRQGPDCKDFWVGHNRDLKMTSQKLLSALNKAYEVIERTREIIISGAEGAICDTIWESGCGTLVDYLESFLLDNPDQLRLETNPTQKSDNAMEGNR